MRLRELRESDADGMLEWMNDPKIRRWFRFPAGTSRKEDVLEFIRKAETAPADGADVHFAAADDEDHYLGTISLKRINRTDHNAEFAVSLRAVAQGKGIAALAAGMLLKKAFEDFQLERVYLNVLAENEKAVRFYEKMGFVYEGAFVNCIFLRGGYRTLKWYRMLKAEYDEKFSGGGQLLSRKASLAKTISESDVYLFAGITGDFNPVHINREAAKNSGFEERIVHGVLTVGLVSAVIGMKLPGEGTIYLEQDAKFLLPVKIGDTITAAVEISEILNEKKRIWRLDTFVTNQRDEKVLAGYAVVKAPAEKGGRI